MKGLEFETAIIHSGIDINYGAPTLQSICESASFIYESAEDMAGVFEGRKFGYLYSRISNPSVTALEKKINAMENGLGAIVTSSGMAAIANVFFTLTEQGDKIVASKSLFGGTFLFFNEILTKFGVEIVYVDMTDTREVTDSISDNTKVIFTETIGNPGLDIPDILSISKIAKEKNIPLVVDSTISTPFLFKSKEYGVSIVIHSTTKYLSGNGSSIGGAIIDTGNYNWENSRPGVVKDFYSRAGGFAFLAVSRKKVLQNMGHCMSPFNAYIQCLGLDTLPLRMEKHCSNALELAECLNAHEKVNNVIYPGLTDNPFHDTANKQFNSRFGGVVSFKLNSKDECFRFVNRLKLAKIVANLGDTKTLVIHPASTIFLECSDEQKAFASVTDEMIRVSVGIENMNDIINDFEQAFMEV